MLGNHGANQVKQALLSLSNIERKELVRAVLALDKSLGITIGPEWLDRGTGAELPYDVHSVVSGGLIPDERGVLKRREE